MNLKSISKDKKVLECLIGLFFLTISHWVQFFRSDYNIQPLLRAICAGGAFFFTLLSGRKYWNPILFVWAIAILHWNRFHNYTSFIMILIAIWLNPKTKFFYMLVYSIGVLISMIIYKDTFTHLIIHFFGCSFFYLIFAAMYHVVQYLKKIIRFLHAENRKLRKENQELKKLKKERLILNPDEIEIISALCAGKEIKEIELYSQNTIYTRLRDARERNGCINNNELKARFIIDYPVNSTD